ncbi:hypothetical protein [Actinoallomurus iriomotensis]|uniref:LPXTG-motif cell wall anchor domain-containing protein n=1 Tax=Actinoallomurus iriomotensis TaxID=478107 RepID=A0A9W6RQD0_9ACTN|nr:hypothetical protein [Actinoallomurus iriomotensis]GLY78197.1 hypothetical protein Airi01_064640 [Actinoallomurus iriomotensis]
MNIARLGAVGGAAAIVALCAAGPAFATDTPGPVTGGGVTKDAPSAPSKPAGKEPTADVTPKSFYGGDTLTFTVENCAVVPTIEDVNGLFVATQPFKATGTEGSYAAKETTRKKLVEGKKYSVSVHCGRWSDTFTTQPHKRPKPTPTPTKSGTPTPTASGTPTGLPSGAPQTGDGSGSGGGNTGLIAGGAAVVIAGLAGGTFLYTRRRSSAGA